MLKSTPRFHIGNVGIYGPGLSDVSMPESYCWEVWFGFIYTESPMAGWMSVRSSGSRSLFIKGGLLVRYPMIPYKEHFMFA